ncbi:MAG: hypothetical protein KatS3mg011_2250 [Acidimicrobiia bacterium]|nr:MAG: hypothetical protein KatS3mg011_2250 [Acidimicrobiia bacterium]
MAAVLGPSYGDAALHAATAHFVVMVRSAAVGLSGPTVVESAVGERVTDEELGGPEPAQAAGTVHLVVDNEETAIRFLAVFLSYLPLNASQPAPLSPSVPPARSTSDLNKLVPTHPRQSYDMFDVLEGVADEGSLLPWQPESGRSVITALGRIEGAPLGIVASQPQHGAGALDPRALAKATAFVDLCDTFNLPLLFLQDVPGLLIGRQAERDGIVRAYERLVARLARARVPRITVIVRKAYGGGHYALGGRPTKPDLLLAWPSAEMGFMAPETGVRTVNRRRLEQAEREGGEEARRKLEMQLTRAWQDESEPWEAAAHLYVDDIIEPAETRRVVAAGIRFAWGSRPRVARPGVRR